MTARGKSSAALAIRGGVPAVRYTSTWPPADEQVHAALEEAYRTGAWGVYDGPYSEKLVARIAELHGCDHVLLCSSGTYAVEAALRGIGVGSGDEVILAGYDFPGNFRAVEVTGARPVLVDIQPENWGLDIQRLDDAQTSATRAVVVSHLHGGMVPMTPLMKWAKQAGVRVVEDACQAPGAFIDGQLAGTSGDVGVLSFGGSKLLTAGRGGAVFTRHEDIYQRAKIYGFRGNNAFPLSELQAAVLLPQLEKLDEFNRRRRESVALLLELTRSVAYLKPVINAERSTQPSYYKLGFRYCKENLGNIERSQILECLQAERVPIDAGFRGFVRRSERRCRRAGSLEHSSAAAESTVLLHHPILRAGDQAIRQVADAFDKVAAALG